MGGILEFSRNAGLERSHRNIGGSIFIEATMSVSDHYGTERRGNERRAESASHGGLLLISARIRLKSGSTPRIHAITGGKRPMIIQIIQRVDNHKSIRRKTLRQKIQIIQIIHFSVEWNLPPWEALNPPSAGSGNVTGSTFDSKGLDYPIGIPCY